MTTTWVVGASGMLGSAVARAIDASPRRTRMHAAPLPWAGSPDEIRAAARDVARRLSATGDWSIIWAAGSAVTAADDATAARELQTLDAALLGIQEGVGDRETRGSLVAASSAGGVYAGSHGPPFSESSATRPLSPYGRLKLASEEHAREFSLRSGVPVVIARIANLYGPGQRLDKAQGLISHLALARLTSRPASIYVPLDNLRDYLFVDDAAAMLLAAADRARAAGGVTTKIFASGQATTVAALIGMFRAITQGRPRVVLGGSPLTSMQSDDLRLRSAVWTDIDRLATTTLPAGISATLSDVMAAVQAGRLNAVA